jgi:hypothetical protein
MGNSAPMSDKDKEQPATPAGGSPVPATQGQQVQPPSLPSIPPMASQQPQTTQPAPAMPQGMPGLPSLPGLPPMGGFDYDPMARLSKGIVDMPNASGAGLSTRIDVGGIDDASAGKHAAGLDMFLRSQSTGQLASGADLITKMQSWLGKATGASKQTAGTNRTDVIGDDKFLQLINRTAELYNTGEPTKRKMADAYANGVMYLTTAYAKGDNAGVTGAKDYLEVLADYTDEDFRNPKTQTYLAQQASKVIKPYVTNKSLVELDQEKADASPEAVRKKLIGGVLYDYVQGRFTELRTDAQSGSPTANNSRKTLNIFESAYGDLSKPTIEGNKDRQVQMFMDSPQGQALIDDAYEQFDGQGLFNTKKAQDLVKRMGGQAGADPTTQVTPQELKDFFGQTRMKRYVSGAMDIDPSLSDEAALRFDPNNPDNDDVYSALTPGGVKALYGQKEGTLVGDMTRAGKEDPYMYDISSNVSGSQTQAPQGITGANSGRIASRPELAGAMASGLNLSEAQLEQVGRKLFQSIDDVNDFVTAGMNSYDIESDIVPKITSDISSVRAGKTGGVTTGGTSKGTYSLITDTFKAVDAVIPGGAQQSSWMSKKRVLNDIAVQARNLEGTAVEQSGLSFAKLPTGENDFNQPLLPVRSDQISRIQVLQGMFDYAGKNSRYRTDLQNLIKSAVDKVPYNGNIKMTPQQMSSLVGLYASRLEEATAVDKKTDDVFLSMFGIKASDYNKTDLKAKILKSLQIGTPARFRTMASTMEVTPEGGTRYIPTTSAGTVMQNADAIPGGTGAVGGRSSKTERTALDRVQRSMDIVNTIFGDAKKSILGVTNSIGEQVAGGEAPKGNFKTQVLNAFDDSIKSSLTKFDIKPEDKVKFDTMVSSIREQIVESATTEWMKGTVSDADIDNVFKKYRTSMTSIAAGYAAPADTSVSERLRPSESTNRAQVDSGKEIYNKAVEALGGDIGGSEKAGDTKQIETVLSAKIASAEKNGNYDYVEFAKRWYENTSKSLDAAKRDADIQAAVVKNTDADIAKLQTQKTKSGQTPEGLRKIDQAIAALERKKVRAQQKGTDALSLLQSRIYDLAYNSPTEESHSQILDDRRAVQNADDKIGERYRTLREQVRNKGFDSLSLSDKQFYYEQGLTRYREGETNTIGVGRPTRLGFNSFLASAQGVNWTVINPDYELVNDNARAPSYLVEIKDDKGKTIGHKLNENVKFTFDWKKDAKTGQFTAVSVVATEYVKQGNNSQRPLRKQKIETGLETAIVKAKNFEVDLNSALKVLDSTTKGNTYGGITRGTRVNRGATKLSSAVRDLLDLTSNENLNETNKQNVVALKAEVLKGLKDSGRANPEEYLKKLIEGNKTSKALLTFSDTLRSRMSDRIDAFAGKGSGRIRTPQEIQDDISKFFNTTEMSAEDTVKIRNEKAAFLQKFGYDVKEVTDADGNKIPKTLPSDAVGEVISILDAKGKVSLTTQKDDVAALRNSVFQKLRPLQDKLQKEVDALKQGDTGRVAKIGEAKKLSGLAEKLKRATSEGELSGLLLEFNSNDPAIKAAQSVARDWRTRKDLPLETVYSQYKALKNKALDNDLTDNESQRLDTLTLVLNKHLKSVAPQLGASPLFELNKIDRLNTKESRTYNQANLASNKVPFQVLFGESAKKIERTNLPTVYMSPEDQRKAFQQWNKKLTANDKKRLAREVEIAQAIGLDVDATKVKLGDLWKSIDSKWESMNAKEWVEYTYGLPDEARIYVLRNYPLWSEVVPNELDKKSGPSGPSRQEINKQLKDSRALTLTPGGHVVPAATKFTIKAPQWVRENRMPNKPNYADALQWKINNTTVEYLDILTENQNEYRYEVKGPNGKILKNQTANTFTTEADGKSKKLKDGYTVLGATVTTTGDDGKTTTKDITTSETYRIGGKVIEVPLYNRGAFLQSRMLPAGMDAELIDQKLIKKEPIVKRLTFESAPVQAGNRLGFEYEGKQFWIGKRDYLDFVKQVNEGKIDTKNVRELVTQLVSRVRASKRYFREGEVYTSISAKSVGKDNTPDVEGIKIPEAVQNKIIADAEAKGFGGLIGKAKKMSFAAVLLLALKEYGKAAIRRFSAEEAKKNGK